MAADESEPTPSIRPRELGGSGYLLHPEGIRQDTRLPLHSSNAVICITMLQLKLLGRVVVGVELAHY